MYNMDPNVKPVHEELKDGGRTIQVAILLNLRTNVVNLKTKRPELLLIMSRYFDSDMSHKIIDDACVMMLG